MRTWEELVREVLETGEKRSDRTGTGTRSIFAPDPLRYPIGPEAFMPLVTTKRVAWKKALAELCWMLAGGSDLDSLLKAGGGVTDARNIWAPWDKGNGDLGPVYGAIWRGTHGGPDQLAWVVQELSERPDTRRAVLSSWAPEVIDDQALPPCPVLYQFSRRGVSLDLHVYQRSADLFIGVPFDLAEYGAFMILMARELGCWPGDLTVSFGDAHIYSNHIEQAEEAISREPTGASGTLRVHPGAPGLLSGELTAAHLEVAGYEAHPAIPAPVAV